VHRIHRDQQPRLTEQGEKLSHARYFIAFVGDGELPEDQPCVVGEHRHQMRRPASGAGGAAHRLAVQRDRQQSAVGGCQPGEVRPKPPVQIGRVQLHQQRPERLFLGRRYRTPSSASTCSGAVRAQVADPA